jgi:hypothetical protein
LQPWVNVPSPSFLEKQNKLKITIYGPYGNFEVRLRGIAQELREKYKFMDTYLVKDRQSYRQQKQGEDQDMYLLDKSFYYLKISDVNLFIYGKSHVLQS